jgi:hypothetical protein
LRNSRSKKLDMTLPMVNDEARIEML